MRRSTGHGNIRRGTLWRVVLAFATFFVAFAQLAQARANGVLRLEGPADASGNGTTPLQIRVSTPPVTHEALGLKIVTNAGRIENRREIEPGLWEITIVPPRVVEPTTLVVEATARVARRSKLDIRLHPVMLPAEFNESNGPLGLRVPKHMILGHDEQAIIAFRGRSSSPIRLYANAGTIEATTSDGDRHHAIFRPPQDKLPRVVVIVAASDDGSVIDWAAIRLYGRPLVSMLSEPQATVIARVAGTEYGPMQADRRGRVDIRVLAPPGVAQGQTVARDATGNERTVPLDLRVPQGREAFAICPAQSERLFIFAVDAEGEARKGLLLRAESTLGVLSGAEWSAAGFYSVAVALPSSAALGQPILFRAQIGAEKESEVMCESVVVGEAPKSLLLSVAPKTWVAGSTTQVRVTARAGFTGERKPRTVALQATADFGEISPFHAQSPELYEAIWQLPAELQRRKRAKLIVRTLSPRSVQAQAVVELQPGPPARLNLAASAKRLDADGHSETRLVATVVDAYKNPVDTPLQIVGSQGQTSSFLRESTGVYSFIYQAPQSSRLVSDDVTIRAHSNAMTAKARIGLNPTTVPLRLWGAVGYSTNLALVHAPMGTVGTSVRLPLLREDLAIGLDAGYLVSRSSARDAVGAETASIATTLVPLSVRVSYEWRMARFAPYVGLGAGVGLVRLGVSSPSAGTWTQWTVQPLVAGMAGTLIRIGPGWALLEAGYRHIPVNETFAVGNVGGLLGSVGYMYEL